MVNNNTTVERRKTAIYTLRYPASVAIVLAEEFGFECLVWLRSSIRLEQSGQDGFDWELAAVALARKAAHFALMADEQGAL